MFTCDDFTFLKFCESIKMICNKFNFLKFDASITRKNLDKEKKRLNKKTERFLRLATLRAKVLIQREVKKAIKLRQQNWCEVTLSYIYHEYFSKYSDDRERLNKFTNRINSWLEEKGFTKIKWDLIYYNVIVRFEW